MSRACLIRNFHLQVFSTWNQLKHLDSGSGAVAFGAQRYELMKSRLRFRLKTILVHIDVFCVGYLLNSKPLVLPPVALCERTSTKVRKDVVHNR